MGTLGVATGVLGGVLVADRGADDFLSLTLLGGGGLFVLMALLTGARLLRAQAVMKSVRWEPCEFRMYSVAPERSWPWVLRFSVPADTAPARIEEGWRIRARQARILASGGQGWLVRKNGEPQVIAPKDFDFLLTLQAAKTPTEEIKWDQKFKHPRVSD